MLNFDVITVFPQLIEPHLEYLPFKKAISQQSLKVNLTNLRNYALDSYGTIDDKPYGGGTGMILMVEPIYNALKYIYANHSTNSKRKILVLTPRGKTYTQQDAENLVNFDQITLISGRYEGIDERVTELNKLIDENIETEAVSIGNYVLSGGELPALVIMESVTRLLPNVLEKEDAAKIESFSSALAGEQSITSLPHPAKVLEYPQYTRPENFMGLTVPEILLSGNHRKIQEWRDSQQI